MFHITVVVSWKQKLAVFKCNLYRTKENVSETDMSRNINNQSVLVTIVCSKYLEKYPKFS